MTNPLGWHCGHFDRGHSWSVVSVNQISSEKLELDIHRVTTEILNKYF